MNAILDMVPIPLQMVASAASNSGDANMRKSSSAAWARASSALLRAKVMRSGANRAAATIRRAAFRLGFGERPYLRPSSPAERKCLQSPLNVPPGHEHVQYPAFGALS
jgi:hypothetical protein